jgi:hypothetical protein
METEHKYLRELWQEWEDLSRLLLAAFWTWKTFLTPDHWRRYCRSSSSMTEHGLSTSDQANSVSFGHRIGACHSTLSRARSC